MAQPPSAHIATVTSLHKTVTNSSALNQIDVSLYYVLWLFVPSIYSSSYCFPVISLTGILFPPTHALGQYHLLLYWPDF